MLSLVSPPEVIDCVRPVFVPTVDEILPVLTVIATVSSAVEKAVEAPLDVVSTLLPVVPVF